MSNKDEPLIECSLQEAAESIRDILEDEKLPQTDVQRVRIIDLINNLLEAQYYSEPGILRLIPTRTPLDQLEEEEALEEFNKIPDREGEAPKLHQILGSGSYPHHKTNKHQRIGSGPLNR